MNTSERIKVDKPIEVWESLDGTWKWKVFRKYQKPKNEAKNEYARWFCGVSSPFTYGQDELGDVYVREIQKYAIKTYAEDGSIVVTL